MISTVLSLIKYFHSKLMTISVDASDKKYFDTLEFKQQSLIKYFPSCSWKISIAESDKKLSNVVH